MGNKNQYMKATKYLFFIGLFLLAANSSLKAQEATDTVLNRNVVVEREYRPTIQEAKKMNVYPEVSVPNVTKSTPQYSTVYSKPLNIEKNIHYLPAAKIRRPQQHYNQGFARLGVGTGFNTLADFVYPLFTNYNTKLDIIFNHYGFFNSKAHSNTQTGLTFTKQLDLFDFYIGAGGSHEFFKYYGKSYNTDFSNNLIDATEENFGQNNLWRFNANVGLHNSSWEDGWRYSADVGYNLYHSGVYNVTEHQLNVKGNLSTELFENRIGLDVTSSNQFYNSSSTLEEEGDTLKSYYVFSLSPYYAIERESFDLRLGFKTYFSIAQGRGFSVMPDIHFDWRFAPEFAALYAGFTGDYKINTLSSIARENLYIKQGVQVKDTYTPLEVFVGVKVKPFNGLLFDAYVDYQNINNQYFFENERTTSSIDGYPNVDNPTYLNVFRPMYSKANLFKVGGRINYTYYEKFNVQVNGAYNNWSVADYDYAWYKPSWELGFSTSVKALPSLNLYANANILGGRYAPMNEPTKLDPIIDINLGADYILFDWMTVFLKINNLINNKAHIWYGYEAQGFNVMAGVVFDF